VDGKRINRYYDLLMTAASASDHCIEYAIIVVALLDNLCTLLKFGALIELDPVFLTYNRFIFITGTATWYV